jgi:hypothetical protein
MATAPSNNLPLFYNDLTPLNSRDHGAWNVRSSDQAKWLVGQHAVPLTVEEFPQAQRSFPIIFSAGPSPVPLALMGLNEGVNTFVDDEGALIGSPYVPAYARRYPFLLAKLSPNTQELSLCFDPGSNLVGDFAEGDALFENNEPSQRTKDMLRFCQHFEEAGMRTANFVKELQEHKLLMDGEVAIKQGDNDVPFTYRGFQMVNEKKLRETRGDQLRKWNDNGVLALIYAHLFSLDLIRSVFGRQVEQGKGPVSAPAKSPDGQAPKALSNAAAKAPIKA